MWLHLKRLDHLHVELNIQQATSSDLSITCSKGVTPNDQSTELDMYLGLGIRVYSIGVATEGINAELRGLGWYVIAVTRIPARCIPWWL
jgi:hypothetical protein